MASANQQLSRHLIECYLFYRNKGCANTAYALTSHDQPVTLVTTEGTFVFEPAKLERSQITRVSDEQYDTVTISTNAVEPFLSEVSRQGVDGINVKLYGVYATELKESYGAADYDVLFWGQSATVQRGDNVIGISFTGWNKRLSNEVPNYYFGRTCNFELYDSFTCKADQSAHTETGTIDFISTTRYSLMVSGTTLPENSLRGGIITFSSCQSRTINNDVTIGGLRTLYLVGQVPSGVDVSDSVQVSRGCDRQFGTCKSVFTNAVNFGGFPFVKIKNPATDNIE